MNLLDKTKIWQKEKLVKKINKRYNELESVSKEYIQNRVADLITEIQTKNISEKKIPDKIIIELFAISKESTKRVLHKTPYDVQLIAGLVMTDGSIAEQRTGEGKGISSIPVIALLALFKKGVHVITANSYLAQRDQEEFEPVFNYMGLTSACLKSSMTKEERQFAYKQDITYGIVSEFGFDYLRDNLVKIIEDKVQRKAFFAIIDECDSILIDEARTPLIISGEGRKVNENYAIAQKFIKTLSKSDYEIDTKAKAVYLTEDGVKKAEKFYNIDNFSDKENLIINHHVGKALHANFMMKKHIDYIKKANEIILVDQFTGRALPGREYSDGLHQAIEAKEHIKPKKETVTLASITIQNYFRLYEKLAGMTGTAKTDEEELIDIYNLNVIQIPTNKPVIRKDEHEIIYDTIGHKTDAVIEIIKSEHEKNVPLLVGTASINYSEQLSGRLKKEGLKHNLLNAKQDAKENSIIAQAGLPGAITIATNMAGRGTDILLGGNPEFFAKHELENEGLSTDDIKTIVNAQSKTDILDESIADYFDEYHENLTKFKEKTDANKEIVMAAGGLFIIGTEKHESERVDNQLRGRAGRQGDPGRSIFILSMEDEIIKRYEKETLEKINDKVEKDVKQDFTMPDKYKEVINRVQKTVDGNNFYQRKHVIGFDNTINKQRLAIYDLRDTLLEKDIDKIKGVIEKAYDFIQNCIEENSIFDKDGVPVLTEDFEDTLNRIDPEILNEIENKENLDIFETISLEFENKRQKSLDLVTKLAEKDMISEELFGYLEGIDSLWSDHMEDMEALKEGIGMRGYAGAEPTAEYAKEGELLFKKLLGEIYINTIIDFQD